MAAVLVALLSIVPLAQPSAARPTDARGAGGAANTKPEPTRLGLSYGNTLVWMSQERLGATLDDAVELNAKWIRADLSWTDVQPQGPGTYRWEAFDRVVRAASERGLQVLPILAYTPAWARDPGCGRFSCPPRSADEFATFARKAVARYAPQGIKTWEVWNEPNFTVFWPSPDAGRYAELLQTSTHAIKKTDRTATVLVGGLAAIESSWAPGSIEAREFLDRVCAADACSRIDGVSYHPYTYPYPASYGAPWFDTAWEKIASTDWSLRSILNAHGLPEVKIWATEYGAPTGGNGTAADGTWGSLLPTTDHVTEDWQAVIARDAVETAVQAEDVVAFFWYTNQDNPLAAGKEAHFGLRRSDGSQKPSWSTYQRALATANAAATS